MPVTIPPTYTIAPGFEKTPIARVQAKSFGNGYEQTAPDGLNHINDRYTVTFTDMTITEAQALEALLRPALGWDTVIWTPPHEMSARKWKLESYRYVGNAGKVVSISAVFVQRNEA